MEYLTLFTGILGAVLIFLTLLSVLFWWLMAKIFGRGIAALIFIAMYGLLAWQYYGSTNRFEKLISTP